MSIKTPSAVILLLSAVLATGCGVTATVSATDVTQPVLLGKVKRLHGTDDEQWQRKVPFDISTSLDNRDPTFDEPRRAGSKANPELLKLIEIYQDKIVIEEVYIGSYSLLFAVGGPGGGGGVMYGEQSWVDIKGGIYSEQAGEHETK